MLHSRILNNLWKSVLKLADSDKTFDQVDVKIEKMKKKKKLKR